ncbi:unnamed protein product [Albugo candida]|uniref:Uncharacterized protein n=1 Tax=Albugo candida TaxID=65357 RepID=A0A024FWL7_9STRA|nr:unnamed protein product [Albugo candida]|eukprot:CCI11563.1 unnamed protein product [Albugo candida]
MANCLTIHRLDTFDNDVINPMKSFSRPIRPNQLSRVTCNCIRKLETTNGRHNAVYDQAAHTSGSLELERWMINYCRKCSNSTPRQVSCYLALLDESHITQMH